MDTRELAKRQGHGVREADNKAGGESRFGLEFAEKAERRSSGDELAPKP